MKIADLNTMYHHTSAKNRASIYREGLSNKYSEAYTLGGGSGIFFTTNPDPGNQVGIDVWSVDVGGLNLIPDDTTESFPGETWWVDYQSDVIEPTRLKLVHSGVLSDTAEFKRWFGDSKVVDQNGKPLVVYHGTIADFDTFARTGVHDRGLWGRGFYFSALVDGPNSYALRQGDGARIIPVYVSIKNPLILKTGSDLVTRLPDGTDTRTLVGKNLDGSKIQEIAIAGGHDGVIQFRPNGLIGDLVAYSPSQIKSAIGNAGTFDPNNPSITEGTVRQRSLNRMTEQERFEMARFIEEWFNGTHMFNPGGQKNTPNEELLQQWLKIKALSPPRVPTKIKLYRLMTLPIEYAQRDRFIIKPGARDVTSWSRTLRGIDSVAGVAADFNDSTETTRIAVSAEIPGEWVLANTTSARDLFSILAAELRSKYPEENVVTVKDGMTHHTTVVPNWPTGDHLGASFHLWDMNYMDDAMRSFRGGHLRQYEWVINCVQPIEVQKVRVYRIGKKTLRFGDDDPHNTP